MMLVEIGIVTILMVLNGFFAMSEMAVVASRRGRLQQMASQGSKGAKIALELSGEPGRFLSAIQIGITLIGILAGAFSGATIADKLGDYLDGYSIVAPYGDAIGVGIVVLCITVISVVLGELVPKRIALANAEGIAVLVARPIMSIVWLGRPVIAALQAATEGILRVLGIRTTAGPTVTEEEVKSLIAEGTQSGVFEKTEQRMIHGVLALAEQPIRAILTPRPDIVWIDLNDPPDAARRLISETTFSRLLVGKGSIDEFVGVLQKKDLLIPCLAGKELDIAGSVRDPLVVSGTVTILEMLEMFRASAVHLAVAVNEYGSVQGIVTLTDILKAIAGDIPEHPVDREQEYVKRKDGSYLIDGTMPIAEAKELLNLRQLPASGSYYTLAGFAMARLGRLPTEGDRFSWEDWRFEIVDMDANRIDKLMAIPRKQGG